MKSNLMLALIVAVTPLAVAPAFADKSDMSETRLQQLDDQAKARGVAVSRQQAMSIAEKNGMVSVHEIDLDDNEWELEGRQANGREIEIDISITDGSVRSLERD